MLQKKKQQSGQLGRISSSNEFQCLLTQLLSGLAINKNCNPECKKLYRNMLQSEHIPRKRTFTRPMAHTTNGHLEARQQWAVLVFFRSRKSFTFQLLCKKVTR